MPLLIRAILQRLFAVSLSVLAFFGISPEVNVPTDEQAEVAQENRDESIKKYFDTVEQEIKTENEAAKQVPTPEPIVKPITTQQPVTPPTPPAQNETEKTISKIVTEATDAIKDNLNLPTTGAENNVVNIICLHREEGRIEAHAGSGVIIDPRGVVITNAHVAQFFLLESKANENYMDCNLYKENIPTYGYTARLLYISPSWIQKNYTLIRDPNPKGTGEGDFAFLYIDGNTNPAIKNPKSFPYASFSTDFKYKVGSKIFVAGYPGAPTNINELTKSVKLRTDSTYISDVFTLGNDSIDIISTGPTVVAQRGASGGGLFSGNSLVGMTATVAEDSEGKKINALTTEYINRNLRKQEGFDLSELLTSDGFGNDLNFKIDSFYEKEVPDMRNLLLRVY